MSATVKHTAAIMYSTNTLVVDSDNNLRAGKNLAIIIDDTGAAKSLRLPGGT